MVLFPSAPTKTRSLLRHAACDQERWVPSGSDGFKQPGTECEWAKYGLHEHAKNKDGYRKALHGF
jgi:hypothetical protein